MWWYGIGIIAELLLLSFVSKRYIQLVFLVLLRIVRSRTIAVTIMTIVLFPGTVLHELSHLFTAEILGVHTGKLTLVPESIEEDNIQSGSVAIAHSDPFRRTAIGIAPFTNGIIVLTALSWWFTQAIAGFWLVVNMQLTIGIIFYLILTVTNTMFTSKEDMVGVIPVFLTMGILLVAGYIAGIRIVLPLSITDTVQSILFASVQNLGIILGINIVGFILFSLLLFLFKKPHTTYRSC
ncbi:MAG: hypothetical protein WAV51_00260 [Microgenomates group bacterium]